MRLAVAILLSCSVPAAAQTVPEELVTAPNALLCLNPYDLKEAMRAAITADDQWIKSLNCARLPAGIPVTRISFSATPDILAPWQVRLRPPNSPGVTMWGKHFDFTLIDGTSIIASFKRSKGGQ